MKLKKFIFMIIVFILISYGIFHLYNTLNNKVNTVRVNTVKVTIPEGYTNEEIGQKLEKSGLVTEKDFINETENWTDNNYWFLKGVPNDKHKLDGFLYPATYSLPKNASSYK